jgi:hypothetical protein
MAEPKFTGTNPYELMQQALVGDEKRRKEALAVENVSSYSNPNTDVFLMDADSTRGVDYAGNIVTFDSSNVGVVPGTVTPGGSSNTPVITQTGVTVPTTPTGPMAGAMKLGPDGKTILRFDGTSWVPYEIPKEEGPEEVPGSDANMPFDRYMESLGTDTLSSQTYRDALARRMAGIEEQQRSAGLSYGDMYEQAKMSQAARRGMSDVSGMTGGMEEQLGARMSAAEIGALSQIGMGRDQTVRGLELSKLDAPMAAFDEARAMQEAERTQLLQGIQMQQAQTLFEQAQSGWMQDPDTGEWTNIDKQTQDSLSLQAINATQRAEVLGEMQYWQAVLADSTQASLHEAARASLGTLQTRYGELLANNSVLTGGPGQEPGPGPGPEDDIETEGFVRTTGQTTQSAAVDFNKSRLNELGVTDASLENPINILKTRFQNQEDIAEAIVELAGDKAVEGYNFADEIQLVNKVLTDPTSITYEEFKEIKENGVLFKYTARYYGVYGWQFSTSMVDGKITEQFMFNDTPQNRELVEYLLENGQVKEDNISIKGGKYTIKSNFVTGSDREYEKYVLDFSRRSTE